MVNSIPSVGLGVYKAGDAVYDAVRYAISVGYRFIDCASFYGNEEQVGRAIRDSGVPREALFVTTKLWPTDFHRPEAAFDESRRRMGLDFIDAYLLHWPGTDAALRLKTWETVCRLQSYGRIGMAGTSNFLPVHLEELSRQGLPCPGCNQLEAHPWFPQTEARDYCHRAGIPVVCWAPLFRNAGQSDPVLLEIAERHRRTVSQIVLRWHVEHGDTPIPKSVTPARILENFSIFDFSLSPEELARIDSLQDGRHVGKDPMTYTGV